MSADGRTVDGEMRGPRDEGRDEEMGGGSDGGGANEKVLGEVAAQEGNQSPLESVSASASVSEKEDGGMNTIRV